MPSLARMSSLARILTVLDLFTELRPTWTPEDIAEQLGMSRPTGYRYVRELLAAGLLRRTGPSRYTLGPRILELDYQIRSADPLSRFGQEVLQTLAERTGFAITLVTLYGDRIITLWLEQGAEPIDISYGRGRTMPTFRGTPSLTLLAFLGRTRQRAQYRAHQDDAQARGLSWEDFLRKLQAVRSAGYGITLGELDAHNAGVAVPVLGRDGQALAAICAVVPRNRIDLVNLDRLVVVLQEGARRLADMVEDGGGVG
jgi:DNA-binding IclR family transcriptional regulator